LGERLSAILDLETLLAEMVNQIKDNFGYYHAHAYLLDERGEQLVVAAGTGEAGAEMKARRHAISLNAPASLVARAARTGEIVNVANVRQAQDWLPNPLLPDTYSEMAVPIMLTGQVVGVLDVQEDEIAGLDEGDASLLRSLANQVAVAIRNARLFNEVETALAEARAAQARYLEQAWVKAKIAPQGGHLSGHHARPDAPALAELTLVEAKRQALAQDRPAVIALTSQSSLTPQGGESDLHLPEGDRAGPAVETIVAPITLQGNPIGALQLHPLSPDQTWSEDDLAIVAAVTEQLAQSAESMRLFEETRGRASREQQIREITDRLRTAPDLERLMAIATEELGRRLDATHAKLELGFESEQVVAGNGHPEPLDFGENYDHPH
jgi:GAF domain-containing protein